MYKISVKTLLVKSLLQLSTATPTDIIIFSLAMLGLTRKWTKQTNSLVELAGVLTCSCSIDPVWQKRLIGIIITLFVYICSIISNIAYTISQFPGTKHHITSQCNIHWLHTAVLMKSVKFWTSILYTEGLEAQGGRDRYSSRTIHTVNCMSWVRCVPEAQIRFCANCLMEILQEHTVLLKPIILGE